MTNIIVYFHVIWNMEYKIAEKENIRSYLPEDTDDELFNKYEEDMHLQIIKIPDVEYSQTDKDKYFLVRRKPEEVRKKGSDMKVISEIKRFYGSYSLSKAISEALLLNDQASFPIHEYCLVLRPTDFEDYRFWLSCPSCGEDSEIDAMVHIKSGRERSILEVECSNCNTKVENETKGRDTMSEWAHCPICGSTDINYECSIPYGFVNFSCDDCDYNTKPAKTDTGFSELDIEI